ncbi:MAG: hypothetical protein KDA87_19165 [Planctomycetales bacterium]|nr:hypothetical protein [Planctomycetales bacterium]
MLPVKKDFSQTERRWFGPLFFLFHVLLYVMLRQRFEIGVLVWPWVGVASAIVIWYYSMPSWQTKIYRAWLLAVAPIGYVVSLIAMSLVFYLAVSPIGWLVRICGASSFHKQRGTMTTYWQTRPAPRDAKSYFRQF